MLKNTIFNGRYKKQAPFLSKAVYKRVRGWRSNPRADTCRLLSSSPSKLNNENTDVLGERREYQGKKFVYTT